MLDYLVIAPRPDDAELGVGGTILLLKAEGARVGVLDLTSGEPKYSATGNPVPFHYVDNRANGLQLRESGSLEDIAPTILGVLGIEKPSEMTGNDLRAETQQ